MTETTTPRFSDPRAYDLSKREDWKAAASHVERLARSDRGQADAFMIELCESAGTDAAKLCNAINIGYDPRDMNAIVALMRAAVAAKDQFPARIDRGVLYAYRAGELEIAHDLIDAMLSADLDARVLANIQGLLIRFETDDAKAIEICHRILSHDPYRVGTLNYQAQLASRLQSKEVVTIVPPISRGVLACLGPGAYLNILDGGATASNVEEQFAHWPADRWRVFGFDPHPDADLAIDKTANVQMIRTALGREPGTVTLHHTGSDGASSIFKPNLNYLRHLLHGHQNPLSKVMAVKSESEVSVIDLDTWRHNADVPPFDFMKLNVQGAELDILKGAPDTLDHCLGIQTEVALAPVYLDSPVFREVDGFLDAAGFTCFDIRKTTTAGRLTKRFVPFMGSRVASFRWPSRQVTEAHLLYLRDPLRPEEAGARRWEDPEVWLRLAVVAEINAQVDFAMQLCETVLERWPSNFDDGGACFARALDQASDFYRDFNLRNI